MSWQRISPEDAAVLIRDRAPVVVDVRDERSFQAGRIPGAVHLDGQSAADFVEQNDKLRPVLVCCYHGNSSQGAAAWLATRGFQEVYSLDGGFEVWRWNHPVES
ncbi:MAG TPA: thiosulfate sulfurtransferase GlpE [Moraxellaceae bacterium]|nr:thiosulfate sulfurtransferase GlpE [Moraxellaceae bacterium]